MAQKDFWQSKWLKDQFNQRNPGQANDLESRRKSQTVPPRRRQMPRLRRPRSRRKEEMAFAARTANLIPRLNGSSPFI